MYTLASCNQLRILNKKNGFISIWIHYINGGFGNIDGIYVEKAVMRVVLRISNVYSLLKFACQLKCTKTLAIFWTICLTVSHFSIGLGPFVWVISSLNQHVYLTRKQIVGQPKFNLSLMQFLYVCMPRQNGIFDALHSMQAHCNSSVEFFGHCQSMVCNVCLNFMCMLMQAIDSIQLTYSCNFFDYSIPSFNKLSKSVFMRRIALCCLNLFRL